MTRRFHRCLVRSLRTVTATVLVASVASCASGPSLDDPATRKALLRDNLSVAAAALGAGQPSVARRLYRSLAERFDDAPEPVLGLAYIAFDRNDFSAATDYFLDAAALAGDASAAKAEALLGAGRSALAGGALNEARQHFLNAREAGKNSSSAAWIANGIGVVAVLQGDYETAEITYAEALQLSSRHPGIAANLVRMLVAAGKVEDAARIHAQHGSSSWLGGDGDSLSRMIEAARRDRNREQGAAGHDRQDPAVGASTSGGTAPAIRRNGDNTSPGVPLRSSAGSAALATESLAVGQSRRLTLDSAATSVLVAAPEVADVQLLSPDVLHVIGKSVGRTSVAVLGEDGTKRDWTVSVVLDIDPLHAILAGDPDLGGVRARRIARGIALSGDVASAALADRALRLAAAAMPRDTIVENELRVAGIQQVSLEVLIAEVQRSLTEDIGVNWEAFRNPGRDLFGFRIGRLATPSSAAELTPGSFPPTHVDGQVSPGLFFGRQAGNARIAGMIDALARAGSANVLARPNLTAVSGEAASFFSGGEYPLPTGYEDGVILFEYKKYGVLLDFVPTVIDSGRIVLKVRPEVSEPSLNQAVQVVGVSIPVINVRRAETTVEVSDGDSIVIGGLFRNASNTREAGLPLLKDIPLLGPLFGSRSIRSEDLELVVIVTARLVATGGLPEERGETSPAQVHGYYF